MRLRTTTYTLPPMNHRHSPAPDTAVAVAFRERITRLERPERHASDATMVRICLARNRSTGLRERLGLALAAQGRLA